MVFQQALILAAAEVGLLMLMEAMVQEVLVVQGL
jgi:hypothetical protein